MTEKQTYQTGAALETAVIDDSAVILAAQTGDVTVLNEVGALVWQALGRGTAVADIAAQIAQEYDVSPAQAAADVETFLQALAARKLLV